MLTQLKKGSFLVFCSIALAACGITAEPAELNQVVELKEGAVEVVSVEKTTSITHNQTGSVVTAPEEKVYYILTYNVISDSNEVMYINDVARVGIYSNDTTDGISPISIELQGVLSIGDYLDEGMKRAEDEVVAGSNQVQHIFEADESMEGLKVRIMEPSGAENLHSIDVDRVVTEREGVEVAQEMLDFMSYFDGTVEGVETALDAYIDETVSDDDMTDYSLEKAMVEEVLPNDCYAMVATSGLTERLYEVCWGSGKIVSVVSNGLR